MPEQTFARVMRLRLAMKRSPSEWLLHNYLFFKVPLARPDAFLRRTSPYVDALFHPGFWAGVALLGLLGLYLVSRQWEAFLATFADMLSVEGIVSFGLSLALVKTLHELGHGYTAVRMGSRVTTMGVAFVVMTPILYTDTTDAWRLPKRRQRVMIDAAGMVVELLVAVLATLAWVFLPDGGMRHAAFALATTGWVLSLAVNLNPLMRFDGYYLFSDLLGIPNLQERSFAMGRWWLRELLFGYGEPQPEPAQGQRKALLVGFAYATWIYRFFLFLGIALLVYHYFFKLLGIFLFMVEVGWFIAMPVWREVKVWFKRRHDSGSRGVITALVVLGLIGALFVPFPYIVRIPAVLTATQQAPAFAPRPARIEAVRVQQGQEVKAGQVLIELSAPEIEQQLKGARERHQLIQDRLGRRSADGRDLSESLVLARELHLEADRINGLERERSRLAVRAPMDGIVAELTSELSPGRWIDEKTRLAVVAKPGALEARGYVDAEDLRRIEEGDKGRFVDDLHLQDSRDIDVVRVSAAAADQLDNWVLASTFGGAVPARMQGGKAQAEHAAFEVSAAIDGVSEVLPLTEIRGEMQIRGRPQSFGLRMLRRVTHVLVREAGA
ncbi:MAG: HlyD family efflux transporter periplasmic adaptor subunit [Proteobacteria bacterium]|nr:HlyD family efflux transporter periplasmic adaptor subunit [Pseudomonadota bacterium]